MKKILTANLLVIFIVTNGGCPYTVKAGDMDLENFKYEVAQTYLQEKASDGSTVERKKKSYGTAMALGLSPIPGAGLIYTEHPVQGALSMVMGILGGILLGAGFTSCKNSDDIGDCQAMNKAAKLIGGVTYGAAYAWDAIGTAKYARKYKNAPTY